MKANGHLFCPDCGLRIYKNGDEMMHIAPFHGNEERCSNCDKTLRRRSPGGQSDTWNFTVVSKVSEVET